MFSNLAIDHTHDEHNAVVKDDGGAVGPTECSATLKRWMFRDQRWHVSLLTLKDESIAHCASARRAEDIHVRCDVNKICDWRIWQSISRNHCSSDILVLDTRDIVEKYVIDNVYGMESQECQQYDNLHANGSCSHEKEQYKLTLNPHERQRTTSCGLVSSLKSDCNLFSRLYVASQFSDVNLNDYFSNENQPCPPSLAAREILKLGTKSDIVRCIEDASEKQDDITPSVDVVMLDGPAMLCVLKPAAAGTLREYASP